MVTIIFQSVSLEQIYASPFGMFFFVSIKYEFLRQALFLEKDTFFSTLRIPEQEDLVSL